MDNKTYLTNPSYSALLSLDGGNSTGTGFCFKHGDDVYLVTAKHVLFRHDGKPRCERLNSTFQDLKGGQNAAEIWEFEMPSSKCLVSPNDDVAIISIGKIVKNSINLESYITVVQQGGFKPIYLDVAYSRTIDLIGIANTVYLMGYPTSLLFSDISASIPLFRKGIVAGFDLVSNVFVIDCPAYYGNSGSPIIEECEDGILRICGVASRYIPFVTEWRNLREPSLSNIEYFNSGYSVCTPINAIIEVINTMVK